jgi:hypothetical protein
MSAREDQRVRTQAALHGEDNLNTLDRWRLENLRDVDERKAEARMQQRQAEQSAVDQLRAEVQEVQQEIASLRAERLQEREFVFEVVGTAIGEFSNKQLDHVEKAIKEIRNMLSVAIERRYGELMGRIDAILPDHRSRAEKSFKFSSERTDGGNLLNDLPDPGEIVRKIKMN